MPTLLVLPRASRFDRANSDILVGPARTLVDETLGKDQYDICYASEYKALSPNYSHIVLSGQESLNQFSATSVLSSARGFVYHLGPQKLVATFWPQDCVDFRDIESNENEDDEDRDGNNKDEAPTRRSNYRFWFRQDVKKLFETPAGIGPTEYTFMENAAAAQDLAGTHGRCIYFDIESHPDTDTITCFSYAVDDGRVKTCCIYDHTGRLRPDSICLMAALQIAFHRNKIVIQNAGFDLPFLAMFHGFSFGPDIEDPMLMHHRIWTEAEKSLAHLISLYINAPYHKSEGGTWHPRSWAQLDQLLRYNSKDVSTLRAVHLAQWRCILESGDDGLRESVVQVNSSIFPYLWTSLHGMPINTNKLIAYRRDRLHIAEQWQRVVSIMAGYELNAGSSQQLGNYFDSLDYDSVSKTEGGAPSTDEAALYKILLRYSNPIVRAILKVKKARKVSSELAFKFWVPIAKR